MTRTVVVSIGNEAMEFDMDVESNESEDDVYAHIIDYVLSNIQIEVI